MEDNNLDLFIKLLSEANKTKDPQKLLNIEAELQKVFKELIKQINEEDSEYKKKIPTDKIELLKDLIDDINKSNQVNNKLFSEFKLFLENRKFK